MHRCLLLAALSLLPISTPAGGRLFPIDGRVMAQELRLSDQAPLPSGHPRATPGFARAAHVISAEREAVVEITVQARFDARLILVDPGGETVAESDDHGSLRTSQVVHRLAQGGPHRAVVTTFAPGTVGSYLIAARRVSREIEPAEAFPPLIDASLWETLSEGEPISGEVLAGALAAETRAPLPPRAPAFAAGVAHRAHPVAVTGERIQSFDLRAAFDGVLTLLAPTGQVLGRSDDHRTADHSRLEDVHFTVPGEYLLVVSGYASGEHGTYTLTIGRPRGGESHRAP